MDIRHPQPPRHKQSGAKKSGLDFSRNVPLRLLLAHQGITAFALLLGLLGIGTYVWFHFNSQINDIDDRLHRPFVFQVNINTASAGELVLLPGVGKKLAQKITSFRDREGRFPTHESLLHVSGLGSKKLAALKPYLLPIEPEDRPIP